MMQMRLFHQATPDKTSTSYFSCFLEELEVDDQLHGWPDRFGSALRKLVASKLEAPIRVLSLFSGGGGLDIAFHDAGFTTLEMVEIEPRYVETLVLNSQDGHRLEGVNDFGA